MWIKNYSELEEDCVMRKLGREAEFFALIFTGLAFLTLVLPLFVTIIAVERESATLFVKGLEMSDFGLWRYVVGYVPTALLVLDKLHKRIPHKYLLVLLLVLLGLFAHNICVLEVREWIYGISIWFVRAIGGDRFLYPVLLVSAGFMLMLHMHYEDTFTEEDWYDDEDE